MMGLKQEMTWKDNRLYLNGRVSGFSVVPDEKYSSMWRVRRPDGSLSDMVNFSRARDAARSLLGELVRSESAP